jgi:TolA-binding protein
MGRRKSKGLLRHISFVLLLVILLSPLPSSSSSPQELLQVGTGAFNDKFYRVAESQFREFLQSYPNHPQVPNVMYLLGKAVYEQKKFAEAKDIFTSLLMSNKNIEKRDAVYFWLARSCEDVGDILCAKEGFLTVITKYPQSSWYLSSLYFLGKISFQEGQFKSSEIYLRRALKEEKITASLSYLVKFWLGLSLYEQGQYGEAEGILQNVVESNFKNVSHEEALYWLGETQIHLKKFSDGAKTFRNFLNIFPQSLLTPNALFGEGWCLFKYGKQEDSLKSLVALSRGFPHTPLLPKALYLMGEIYIGLDKYKDAIEVLKELISRFPQDRNKGKALLNLGWCYLKVGDLVRIKEIAYEIVKLPPGEREKDVAQYILAELNSYEGKCQEALPYWFNLLNNKSYRQDALFKIAVCSFKEKKFKESLVNLDLLELEYPDFKKKDEALWMKGESFRELGSIPEAEKAYQKIVNEHKKSIWYPWCIYRIITILTDKGDIAGGEKWFETLKSVVPYSNLSYESALKLGILNEAQKNYKSSLRYFDIAVQSSDKKVSQNALIRKGAIYFTLKEYQKALECYQGVIGGKPFQGDSIAAIAYLEIGNIKYLLKDKEAAHEAYKKAMEISGNEEFINKVKSLLKEMQGSKEVDS